MDKLWAVYSTTYNTSVEYHGSNPDVIRFLGTFDIWGCATGYRKEDSIHFEFSKDMYTYMKSDDFKRIMKRMNVECEIH